MLVGMAAERLHCQVKRETTMKFKPYPACGRPSSSAAFLSVQACKRPSAEELFLGKVTEKTRERGLAGDTFDAEHFRPIGLEDDARANT